MNDVCILLHGIEADPTLRLWNEEVEARYQPLASNYGIQLIARKYGYVPGFSVWFNSFKRREIVDHEEIYFAGAPGERLGLLEDIPPGAKISIVGHSLGGYITTALLKRGIRFHRIAHLWGSTISDFNWQAVEGNFDRVRVYWSPSDEILTASQVADGEDPELALGLMGKEGPSVPHPQVEPIKEPFGFKLHNQFMDLTKERDEFWQDMFQWMGS